MTSLRRWALTVALLMAAITNMTTSTTVHAARASGCLLAASAAEMVGTGGDDCLIGSGQGDVIRGKAGADVLAGGKGSDVIKGGPGADRIWPGHGYDFVRCGVGEDVVFERSDPLGLERIDDSCETVARVPS